MIDGLYLCYPQIGKALVRILRNRRELQYVILSCIRTMAQEHPAIFRPFLSELFIKESDPVFNRCVSTCLKFEGLGFID